MPLGSKRGRTRSKKVTRKISESKNDTDSKDLKEVQKLNDFEDNEQKNEVISSSKLDLPTVKEDRKTIVINKGNKNGTQKNCLADIDETKESTDSPMPVKRSARTKTRRNDKNNCIETFEENITIKIPKRQKKDSTYNISKRKQADITIDYKEAINNECFVQLSERICSTISNEKSINKSNEPLLEDNPSQMKKDSNGISNEQDKDLFEENGLHSKETLSDNRLISNEATTKNNYVNPNNEKATCKTFKQIFHTSVPSTSATCQELDIFVQNQDPESDNFIKAPCHCNARIQCYGPYSEGSYASKRMVGKGIEILKSLKHEKTIMAGFLKIYYESYLSGRATNNTVYFVVEGKLRVNISGKMKVLNVDDCFMVIQDTEYEIRNIDIEPARLSFVKTSRVL